MTAIKVARRGLKIAYILLCTWLFALLLIAAVYQFKRHSDVVVVPPEIEQVESTEQSAEQEPEEVSLP